MTSSNDLPYGASVPNSWKVVPLKHLAALANGYVFKSDAWEESGTPIIRIENLNGSENFNYSNLSLAGKYRVGSGDLLFAWSGNPGTSFGPFRWNRPGLHFLNQHIFNVSVRGCEKNWLYWSLRAATHWIERELTSGMIGMVHVTKEELSNVPIPIPPPEDQRRIAEFLEAETVRIDRLGQLDRSLMGLLGERRQAVVDCEVNSASPVSAKLFWSLSLLRDGTHQPPPRVISGVPLLTARNVSGGKVELTDLDTFVSESDADVLERSLRVAEGDVLLSVKGTVGACAGVPSGFPRVVLDRNVALLRPLAGYSSEWLTWVLRSTFLQEQMRISVTAAAQPGLPLGIIRELRIPEVPAAEQRGRADRISKACAEIDRSIELIKRKESVLRERRQALIAAAVTGQFDVSTASGRGVTE